METTQRDGPIWSTIVAVGLAVLGILATQFTTLPAFLVDPALFESPTNASIGGRTLLLILNFLGFVLAGGAYLAWTGRGWSYVDLRWPTKRGWLYVLAGIAGSIAFYFLASVLIQMLRLPTADSQVLDYVGTDQTMILVMIVIVFFFNAPAEEFLFRNVVQKRLYAAFTRLQSVAIASLIFALIHFPTYVLYAESIVATGVSLAIVFGGAIIFGYLYAETDNLVVPIAAHAAFNAFQFGLLYIAIEYNLDGAEPTTSLLVDLVASMPL
ncbi:CPBP family intramembrane glutamic endopeptidase [Halosolutus gelatinilyticus]|uniref:CPBP family intramembrane glutamic endopeptidase n=1 Tax=Halosolutus gelatinilyticus TaxID=2931975 RepID=UPI001FF0E49D|nr:CPBP family intramembrane glutamic endopeptidase [Halosolutus gelatinilyticus]